VGPRVTLQEPARSIHPRCNVACPGFRRSSGTGSFLILPSLIGQLLDTPIAQHHLNQRALRFSFLGICEGEFNGVEVIVIVIGFGGMTMTPSVTARILA